VFLGGESRFVACLLDEELQQNRFLCVVVVVFIVVGVIGVGVFVDNSRVGVFGVEILVN
jgi:hypothetical protein